jgi:hypothetical protein
VLRQHTRASLYAKVSPLAKGGSRVHQFSGMDNKEERAHSSWNLLAKLERSLLLVQVPLYLFTCCIPCLRHHIYTLSF